MAYLRTWDQVLQVLGSRNANEIDDAFREAHFDFTQRLADILEGGPEADPWALKASSLGIAGKTTVLASTAAVMGPGEVIGSNAGSRWPAVVGSGGQCSLTFPIVAPVGAKLTLVELIGAKKVASPASVFMTVSEVTLEDATVNVLESIGITTVSPDIQIIPTTTVNAAIADGKAYAVTVALRAESFAGSAVLVGIRYTLEPVA